MPRGAKSLFYGKLPSSIRSSAPAFHLFTSQPRQLLTGTTIKAPLGLQVVINSKARRRVNQVAFNYAFEWPPTTWKMQFYWLDPITKKQPLLVIDSFSRGIYGAIGVQHFIAFPKGWSERPVVQQLSSGSWRASDTLGQTNLLVLDDKGKVGIDCFLSPANDGITTKEIEQDYTIHLRWDGKQFKPSKPLSQIARSYYSPPQ